MAITRSQMRRQLYRGGGIASVPRRQKYGLGDWVRKLIPNEIANVASKAAPFVAPFNPIAAGLMRGIGRYDKRGNLGDALKQGLGTYAGGQAARYLGGAGMQSGIDPRGGLGIGEGAWASPFKAAEAGKFAGYDAMGYDPALPTKKPFLEKFGKVGEFLQKGKDKFGKMTRLGQMGTVFAGGTTLALLADKIVGPKKPDETMGQYLARRKSSVGEYLRFYYKRTNPLAGETEVQDFVDINTKEYASGGRVGYNIGSPREDLEAGAESIVYEGNMDPNKQMASYGYDDAMAESRQAYEQGLKDGTVPIGLKSLSTINISKNSSGKSLFSRR